MAKLLIVDDTPPVLRLMQRSLGRVGHDIVSATTGESALLCAEQHAFDAAVVDYGIPEPNGLEVLTRLRQLQPNCVRILVSGGLDVSITIDAVNRGEAARVLRKPYKIQTLVDAVDQALESRERNGQHYLSAKSADDLGARAALVEAIEQNGLRWALQPIIGADDRSIVAYEALLRSRHPSFSGPLDVLDAAERHELIGPLGALAARHCARWLDRLKPRQRLFINLHPSELADAEGLMHRLGPLTNRAHRVVLEITERSSLQDLRTFETSVGRLRNAGFGLAIDDLGAGYNSLALLAELEPDVIKVDMSITRNVNNNRHKQRLFDLVCRFAESSETEVVAEGIETEEESATVIECGATLLQGYLFGKPQLEPAELQPEAEKWTA